MYVYIYMSCIYLCLYMCVYIYIYTYIYNIPMLSAHSWVAGYSCHSILRCHIYSFKQCQRADCVYVCVTDAIKLCMEVAFIYIY